MAAFLTSGFWPVSCSVHNLKRVEEVRGTLYPGSLAIAASLTSVRACVVFSARLEAGGGGKGHALPPGHSLAGPLISVRACVVFSARLEEGGGAERTPA